MMNVKRALILRSAPALFVSDFPMKSFLCTILFGLAFVAPISAQSTLAVSLSVIQVGGDTLEVALTIGSTGDSLSVPIRAFQFDVQADSTLAMLYVDSRYTLSDKEGWTVASNTQRMRVAGFSSSIDAIETGGTLVTFGMIWSGEELIPNICLEGLRLNSGDPVPDPVDACVQHL